MKLTTQRLTLRPLSRVDVPQLSKLHADPEVAAYIGLFGNLDPATRVQAAGSDGGAMAA